MKRFLTCLVLLFGTWRAYAITTWEHDWTFQAFGGKFGIEETYSGWTSSTHTRVYFGQTIIFQTSLSAWALVGLAAAALFLVAGTTCFFRRRRQ